jgi:hypothetical protein
MLGGGFVNLKESKKQAKSKTLPAFLDVYVEIQRL